MPAEASVLGHAPTSHPPGAVEARPHANRPGVRGPDKVTEVVRPQAVTSISVSQKLWRAAYDEIAEHEDTAKLSSLYVKTLKKALGAGDPGEPVSDDGAPLVQEDPGKQQALMRKLVEEGLAKVSGVSKATKMVGDVVQFVLSVKGMVDLAVNNIPQAALPWAGVCVGLQVSTQPGPIWPTPCHRRLTPI